ncbi:Arogenate dehydratase/prephenate dehydratase 2 chloroplastic [Zea mays]|uniref:Arogenate dehydratase n=1 Tax=Zea mays TaxID=4577 RepID=A0A1D6JYY7_MAIZE|nr:Arogenate dehydratase/prephenate dehydratase 2 chloroplastic [Zea mays]
MAPTACLRTPFFPARARSTNATPFSPHRRFSLKCSASNGDNSNPNSISISPTSPPRLTVSDGVESVDVNGLRRPPAPASVPAARDPHWLPRPLTSADVMEVDGKGLKVAYQVDNLREFGYGVKLRVVLERTAKQQQRRRTRIVRLCPVSTSTLHFRLQLAARVAHSCVTEMPTAYGHAVQNWVADRAVLPLENSLGGSIHRNYDLLLRHSLHIVGEVRLAVRHCLLANPGVKIENLKSAMSHPQVNCLVDLSLLLSLLLVFIGEHMLQDTGAIASSLAAKLYGLDVLAENIQDDKDNVTRFMMLAREPIIPRTDKPFKTSIVFSLEEGPGQLFKALAVFALRDINLTKIESRPHKERPLRVSDDCSSLLKNFDYLFYVDLEASMADPKTQNALGNLKEFATFLRVLGSYPTDVNEP